MPQDDVVSDDCDLHVPIFPIQSQSVDPGQEFGRGVSPFGTAPQGLNGGPSCRQSLGHTAGETRPWEAADGIVVTLASNSLESRFQLLNEARQIQGRLI